MQKVGLFAQEPSFDLTTSPHVPEWANRVDEVGDDGDGNITGTGLMREPTLIACRKYDMAVATHAVHQFEKMRLCAACFRLGDNKSDLHASPE